MRFVLDPFEDHPPSIVNSDRMKLLKIALEFLQANDGGILKSSRRLAALIA